MPFRNHTFQSYWFETGTPTFLINLLTERQAFAPRLERLLVAESLLSTFGQYSHRVSYFQAGYLTIASSRCLLGQLHVPWVYPNLRS